jgi:SRSO17 transposase
MVREIVAMGFEVKMVLADSLDGESETTFIEALEKLKLNFIVAIRSNHGVWMPKGARVRANKWKKFTRTMSEGKEEERYIREIIFGRKRRRRYWEMTTGREDKLLALFTSHPEWNEKEGWKNGLNNLRLILQPFLSFNAIVDWLKIFPIPQLSHEFSRLIAIMNFFVGAVFDFGVSLDFHFSSA